MRRALIISFATFIALLITITSAAVDTSLIGISEGDVFEFKLTQSSGDQVYMDAAKTMKVVDGDTFTIEVDKVEEGNSDVVYEITVGDDSVKLSDKLDIFGQYAIHTDWDYWLVTNNLGLKEDLGFNDGTDTIIHEVKKTDTIYSYELNLSIPQLALRWYMLFEYNLEDGMMETQEVLMQNGDLNTGELTAILDYKIERITTTYDTAPGFTIPLFIIGFNTLIILRKKK